MRQAAAGGSLFVYGTLQFPEILEAVTGHRFPGTTATLSGYRRRRLEHRPYPGIVAAAEDTTGRLYRDLDARSLERLDVFEGRIYERRRVETRTEEGVLEVAWTYVVADRYAYLMSPETWDARSFWAVHGDAFLAACERFRREGVV